MWGDWNLLSFHLVLLGPNFHFHTCKALTSEEEMCLDGLSSCWHCLPLKCSLSYCTISSAAPETSPEPNPQQQLDLRLPGVIGIQIRRSSAAGAPQDKKHQGDVKGWAAEVCPRYPSQDTRRFVCSALTPWAALAENTTGETLHWTTQVPQNSTCRQGL